ncbi:NAD-dependent epimerase/dehydratase family protein [Thermodesulfobacteriota bacterium]
MSLKKVLVTGATGQIGNAVFMRLKEQPEKYDVYALDRSATFSARVPKSWVLDIPKERLYLCDMTDMEGLRRAVQDMDVVVHLAADITHNWESILNSNIIGAYNAFEACRQAGVGRVIVGSSITVSDGYTEEEPYKAIHEKRYEDVPADFPKVTPNIPAKPMNLYSSSKVWWESLARTYSHEYGMSCIAIRIGQVERDRPRPPQGASIFVSVRDIVQIFELCINADDSLRFDIFYGMSNNDWRWVDIEHARDELGFEPQDRAEDNWTYD